jgi:hypothetical protein
MKPLKSWFAARFCRVGTAHLNSLRSLGNTHANSLSPVGNAHPTMHINKPSLYRNAGWATSLIVTAFVLALVTTGCGQNERLSGVASDAQAEASSQKGPVQMTTSIDRKSAQIAETIEMTVTLQTPTGVTVQFPQDPQSRGDFEVVGVQDELDIPESDHRRWTRVYELESLTAGDHEIPEVAVQFTDNRGGEPIHDTISSQASTVSIASVLEGQADPRKFRDIKDVVDMHVTPESKTNWVAYASAAGGLVVMSAMLLLVWRRRNNIPPHRWALAELDCLAKEDLLAQGLFQEFYDELTWIIRQYVEKRFEINAAKLTTDEFLKRLREQQLLNEQFREPLEQFLAVADMVKFAQFTPGDADGESAIGKAREFVTRTAERAGNKNNVSKEEVAA